MLAGLMGADRVEIVHELRHASQKAAKYDIIVYEETPPGNLQASIGHRGSDKVIVADLTWVSDCLITGSLMEYREPED
jgi:hypothetical protein